MSAMLVLQIYNAHTYTHRGLCSSEKVTSFLLFLLTLFPVFDLEAGAGTLFLGRCTFFEGRDIGDAGVDLLKLGDGVAGIDGAMMRW